MRTLLFTAAFAVAAPAFAESTPQVLARYPSGAYLENLSVAPDGAVLFTSYFAKTIEIWRDGSAKTFATLDVHPVNVLAEKDGVLLLAHGGSFLDGPGALRDTNVLVQLDRDGKETRRVKLPGVVFGNGMIRLGKNAVLLTDSALGQITHVDLKTGATAVWFKDAALAPDPARPQLPGANGLKRAGDALYVSSSAAKAVFRLALDGKGRPKGALVKMAEAEGADDLAIAKDGALYFATHAKRVVKRTAAGVLETVVDAGIDGCTAVAFSRDGKTLYVLGTGGLFEGEKGDAQLVAVPIGG